MPALGLLDEVQIGDTGPAESTQRGNLQRVGLLFLGSRDIKCHSCFVLVFGDLAVVIQKGGEGKRVDLETTVYRVPVLTLLILF